MVYWFERMDDGRPDAGGTSSQQQQSKESYRLVRTIKVPVDPTSTSESDVMSNQKITHLAISPAEQLMVASTDAHQLYGFSLKGTELSLKGAEFMGKALPPDQLAPLETIIFEPIAQAFHHGQILGLDTCIRKPLIATCATDRSVRIWNFESK